MQHKTDSSAMDEIREEVLGQQSKKLQITFNGEMLVIMEENAKLLGMTLNQYIIYCVSLDIDKRTSNKSN
ncbi:hypothetical protein [Aliarcobacter cryaerophilus]|uniref:hypothetical protein n=1 Tax=Aliarcobacter cryaerophilus TaxID=28198 RepID=UPI000826CF14|nr:hypothetical protein [Aliarcobacter cryaerophilus]